MSVLVSEKKKNNYVGDKTQIRLKVLNWGDGEILPFWQKATKRQANKQPNGRPKERDHNGLASQQV